VFYSRVSELIVGKKWPDIRELFERVVRVNMALVFFLTAGVIVFLVPLLNILFLGSRFTANDINILFYLILIMLIYLIVIAYETYLVQIVYAQKMATIVGVNASVGVIVFFISAWLSSRMLGVYGIAIGIAITQIIVCFLYYYFVNKQLQIPFKKLLMKIGKGLIIAFVFAVLGIGIKSIIYKDSIMILFVMPVWISLYSLFIRSFMKKEIEFIGIKDIFKSG
jgi:putative peptidoglycan lipid II flippase